MTNQMDDLTLLPPLPYPAQDSTPNFKEPGFTADQMREYAKKAVAQLEQDNASLREQNTMLDARLAEMEKALTLAVEALKASEVITALVGAPSAQAQPIGKVIASVPHLRAISVELLPDVTVPPVDSMIYDAPPAPQPAQPAKPLDLTAIRLVFLPTDHPADKVPVEQQKRFVAGWNGALDLLATKGPLYTTPATTSTEQGERPLPR